MIERICGACGGGNAAEAETCSGCGAALEQSLARRQGSAITRQLPALPARWQQAGKAVALGAVALAVEVGAAWLQQRAAGKPAPLVRVTPQPTSPGPRLVARQRVWDTYEAGVLSRRVVEQTVWRMQDE